MALTSPPPIPQRGDPATFSDRVDAFLTWEGNTLVPELNALEANLSSIAAGGAYAIPYVLNTVYVGNHNGGRLFIGSGTQSASATLAVDGKDAAGVDWSALFSGLSSATSSVKCDIRIVKVGDPSKFLTFRATSIAHYGAYGDWQIANTGGSGPNPFANNDAVMVYLTRAGDMGPMGTYQVTLLRDVKANAAAAQGITNGWNRRVLNTIAYNGISGALLNNYAPNTFSLPAGTYLIEASASIYSSQGHMLRLVNAATGAVLDTGTSELSNTGGSSPVVATKSFLRSVVTVTGGGMALGLDHFSNQSGGFGGYPAGSASGATEMYAEIKITKIAS